jgi:CHRD domain
MRKVVLLGLVGVIGLLGISTVALADRGKGKGNDNATSFATKLNGWEEVPSQVTTGKGSFTAQVVSPTRIDFTLRYRQLEGNPVLFAHIHVGSFHENGGVSAFLCGGGAQPACPAGNTPAGATINGSILGANIVDLSAQGVEAGNAGFPDLLRAIRKGETYVNVHTGGTPTPRAPGGEIRGQIHKADHDDDD